MRQKTTRFLTFLTLTLLALGTWTSSAQSREIEEGLLKTRDRYFLQDAAQSGLMQLQMGALAVRQGASQSVRDLGNRLLIDHTLANRQLMNIAMRQNINLPIAPSYKQQQTVDRLRRLSGDQFDREWLAEMNRHHEKEALRFSEQAQDGSDQQLKVFAAQTLPLLQEHQQMVAAALQERATATSPDERR